MEKKCFVIMPISDCENYVSGHFGRVYEYIIKPACEHAGFIPVRADEIMTTNYIALDIIKHIINSEMSICDLSSRNPNVLYELGIRQAFNLPVTLIKDSKTNRIFDIQGIRDIEYDESLRIDTVQETIDELSQVISNTYQNKSEVNSLVSLLGIEPAKLSGKKKISAETELILNSIMGMEKRLSEIEVRSRPIKTFSEVALPILPDNVGEILTNRELETLAPGEDIYHSRFGKGNILAIKGSDSNPSNQVAIVRFENGNEKQFLLRLARLRRFLK